MLKLIGIARPLPAPVRELFEDLVEWLPSRPARWIPAIDIVEGPDAYTALVEVPGVDPEKVELTVEQDRLLIRGEKVIERTAEGEGWRHVERRYGSFERSLPLPEDVDRDRIEASSRHGVLRIVLPKTEAARARRIRVK